MKPGDAIRRTSWIQGYAGKMSNGMFTDIVNRGEQIENYMGFCAIGDLSITSEDSHQFNARAAVMMEMINDESGLTMTCPISTRSPHETTKREGPRKRFSTYSTR